MFCKFAIFLKKDSLCSVHKVTKPTRSWRLPGTDRVAYQTHWFESYLSDRQQIVNICKTMSKPITVKCGVPQGSILRPLLFLCYVINICTIISNDCKLILYADECTVLFSHTDHTGISQKLSLFWLAS